MTERLTKSICKHIMIKFLRFLKNRTKTFKKTSRAVKKTWSTATEEKLFRWQHIFHQKSRRSKGNGTKFATWWKKTVNPEFYIYKIYCSGIKIRKTFSQYLFSYLRNCYLMLPAQCLKIIHHLFFLVVVSSRKVNSVPVTPSCSEPKSHCFMDYSRQVPWAESPH